MSTHSVKLNGIVAAAIGLVMNSLPAHAQESAEAQLLRELKEAAPTQAERVANRLIVEWSKSGSPAMDLLLKRGRDALDLQDFDVAIEHLTALTDHAPEFAEGWQGLALAYFSKEMYGPALGALEHTLALNPNHFGAMRGLGALFERVGKPDLAYKAYQKVLEVHPHDAEVTEAIRRLAPQITGTAL